MGKLFIGVLLLLIIGVGWFLFNPGNMFDYVVTVDKEVADLEAELVEIDAAVTAGTLTAAQATEAKVSITNRLAKINAATNASSGATLTPAQQSQLAEGLDRLKSILINYKDTLATVEATAVEADVKAKLNTGGSSRSKNLSLVVAETINVYENTVSDSVDEYETNDALDAQVDTIVEDIETEAAMEADMGDMDAATTTEDEASEEIPTMDDDTAVEVEVVNETTVDEEGTEATTTAEDELITQ